MPNNIKAMPNNNRVMPNNNITIILAGMAPYTLWCWLLWTVWSEAKEISSKELRMSVFNLSNVTRCPRWMAHSIDTDSMVNALRRFISIHGCPEQMRTDRGTNFTRAERKLIDWLINLYWKIKPNTCWHTCKFTYNNRRLNYVAIQHQNIDLKH